MRLPAARASGDVELEIVVDAHERYPYKFADQQVRTRPARPAVWGLRGQPSTGWTVAAVERKSLADLVSSLTSGRLRFALGELATLPRAAVVVEDRYSQVFTLDRLRPATGRRRPGRAADPLADHPDRLLRDPQLAEEWTYRFLAAAPTPGRHRDGRAATNRPRPRRDSRRNRYPRRKHDSGTVDRGDPRVGPRQRHRPSPTVGGSAPRSIRPGGTPTGSDPSLPSAGPLSGPRRSPPVRRCRTSRGLTGHG